MAVIDACGSWAVEAKRAARVRGRCGRRRARPIAEILERRQLLATIKVTSAGDDDGADGSGTLSLRQAIEIANGTLAVASLTPTQQGLVVGALSTPNTIDFAIPGTGPFVISPASALPAITSPVVIDGDSEPGARPNTNGPGQGKNTVLQIELDGSQAGPNATGLDIQASNSTVRGLAIGGFSVGLVLGSVSSTPATGDLVQGNFIGTDVTGTRSLPNATGIDFSEPIFVLGGGNSNATIGGTAAGAGNVISGNGIGLSVSSECLLQGNLIGTDITGTRALPNDTGLSPASGPYGPDGSSNTIGGTAAGAANVISGNTGNGMTLGSSNLVQGNFIGTDVTGTEPLPNGAGIGVASYFDEESLYGGVDGDETIGGTTAGAGNVISGNTGNGMTLGPSNLVQGNFIGTDLTGARSLPNGGDGIRIGTLGPYGFGTLSTIGGTTAGAANVIAFNGGAGVNLDDSGNGFPGNATISANSIFANAKLGIDLGGDGVTPNNPAGSPDAPNLLQPYPVLTSAELVGTGTLISGTLDSMPSTSYTVEFFANPSADPSGFGQGKTYLGSAVATTDAAGHASFSFTSGLDLLGQAISATATDPKGNTSEFARDVTAGYMTATSLVGPGQFATLGRPTTFAAVVSATAAGVPTGQVNFLQDGVVIGSAPLNARGVAVLITTSLSPGPHAITAAYAGDMSHSASQSDAITLSVFAPLAFGGPSVTSTGGVAPDLVTIDFNRGLFPGPAQDPANYSIVGPGNHKIAVESALYDPATDSVTLTTLQKLAPGQSYQLTINGSQGDRVVDVFGIPLNGRKGGKPGHDYVGKVAVKKAPVAKVAHPSGPKTKAHK